MIAGEKVVLRPASMDDLQRFVRWANDPEVALLGRGRPYPTPAGAEEGWLRERIQKPGSYDRAFFAIDTAAGEHIGSCDIFDCSPEDRWAWLGIMIGEPSHWSRGLGREAVTLLLQFAFDEMNLQCVRLQVWDFNERAIACYLRCGFVEEARLRQDLWMRGAYHDLVVMGVLREEFEARTSTGAVA